MSHHFNGEIMKKENTYSAPMLVAGADGKLHVKHVVAPAKSK